MATIVVEALPTHMTIFEGIMLVACKNTPFTRWFTSHVQRRLRNSFAEVRVVGLGAARQTLADGPVLFVANHTAFWDALIIIWLSNALLQADAYAWMDADNLRRLPFFRWVGAFGVQRQAPGDVLAGMRYAVRLLGRPKRAVWLFAQGEERPLDCRPLGFLAGSRHLARRAADARVVPVAFRYELAYDEKPWAQITFGAALPAASRVEGHEAAVTALLDDQREARVVGRPQPGDVWTLQPRRKDAKDNLPTRILATLARWLLPHEA